MNWPDLEAFFSDLLVFPDYISLLKLPLTPRPNHMGYVRADLLGADLACRMLETHDDVENAFYNAENSFTSLAASLKSIRIRQGIAGQTL